MIITLSQAKKQLNIESDFEDDDELITELIEVSETVISNDINRLLVDVLDVNGLVPSPLKHAAKILVAHFYKHREITVESVKLENVPISYKYLINAYKNFTVG